MKQGLSLRVLVSGPCELDFSWYDMIQDELLRRTVKLNGLSDLIYTNGRRENAYEILEEYLR